MDEVPFSRLFDNREGPYPPDDEGGMAPDALGRNAMRELTVPIRHEWLTRERAYGKIAIEPFESGFALTVGNAYRRVLNEITTILGGMGLSLGMRLDPEELERLHAYHERTIEAPHQV